MSLTENKKKTTLQRLEEKILNAFPVQNEKIVEILHLLREEYENEKKMVINFSIGITPRMNYQDIVDNFDETYRVATNKNK